jgi:hypothetical protein
MSTIDLIPSWFQHSTIQKATHDGALELIPKLGVLELLLTIDLNSE